MRKHPPPMTHQQSFASIRQFTPNNKLNSKATRFSIRRKEDCQEEDENKMKRVPSQRKMGVSSHQKLTPSIPERKSKSIAGSEHATSLREGNDDSKQQESSERRKHSLTMISQKAKKSMQRKFSELIRNERLLAARKAVGLDTSMGEDNARNIGKCIHLPPTIPTNLQ